MQTFAPTQAPYLRVSGFFGRVNAARVICLALLLSFVGFVSLAAQEVKIAVKGEVPAATELTLDELAKLPRDEVRVKDRSGQEAVYAGTPLAEVLRAAGMKFEADSMPSRSAVASYVLVEAADGYKAVFALSEIDPTQSDRIVLLADHKDGQPLDAKEGPCRIIAPGDKRPTRSVRQVNAISIRQG